MFVCFSRVRDGQLLHTSGDLYRTVLRHLSASEVPTMADSKTLVQGSPAHLADFIRADGAHCSVYQGPLHSHAILIV